MKEASRHQGIEASSRVAHRFSGGGAEDRLVAGVRRVAHLFRGGGVEDRVDSRTPRLKPWGTLSNKATRRVARVLVVVVTCALGVSARADSPADRFIAGLNNDPRMPADARELVRKTWSECQNCDREEFLAQGLAVLSAKFRAGLDAYDAEQYGDCAGIMNELRADENPFVAINAAVYEIKALVAMERLLEAGERVDRLLDGEQQSSSFALQAADPVATYSYFAPEIAFLRGFCLLADLRYDEASAAMTEFLDQYPDSSQRLTLAAKQMLAELQNRQPERIGEVVDLMHYSGRRLKTGDAGETVQTRQQRIIELLDKLIKDAEDQENNSNSSSSSGGSDSKGGQMPSTPMNQSKLPGGAAAEGSLRDRRRANPGEAWGSMPPAERERILQALRDNFPSRYRRLVEQYYEELAKKP